MTNYIVSLLCAIVACVYAEHITSKQYESCDTPARTPGQCILFRDCPELIRVYKNRPSSLTDAYLEKAHCGLQGVEEKVCCSIKGNDFELVFAPDTKSSGDPTRLLPDKDFCGKPANYNPGESLDELYDFPWTALIEYRKYAISVFHCVGSLISDRYVLTAARCLKPRYLPIDGELVGVRLGEYNLKTAIDCAGTPQYRTCSEKAIDVPVVETIAHEAYNPLNNFNDIALLRLDKDVAFTDFIKPICLPIYPDLENTSFSWGYLTVSGWETSNRSIKRRANLFISPHCDDVIKLTGLPVNMLQQLCAYSGNRSDFCRGDDGSPLMYFHPNEKYWSLIGIMSFEHSTCGPDVYTRVTNYVPWIMKHIRP